jgi:hypothetical protein
MSQIGRNARAAVAIAVDEPPAKRPISIERPSKAKPMPMTTTVCMEEPPFLVQQSTAFNGRMGFSAVIGAKILQKTVMKSKSRGSR